MRDALEPSLTQSQGARFPASTHGSTCAASCVCFRGGPRSESSSSPPPTGPAQSSCLEPRAPSQPTCTGAPPSPPDALGSAKPSLPRRLGNGSVERLHLIERFFRDLTDKRIRRDAFPNVQTLISAIEQYIADHNQHPRPFVWTKTAPDILAKVVRARAALVKGATA